MRLAELLTEALAPSDYEFYRNFLHRKGVDTSQMNDEEVRKHALELMSSTNKIQGVAADILDWRKRGY